MSQITQKMLDDLLQTGVLSFPIEKGRDPPTRTQIVTDLMLFDGTSAVDLNDIANGICRLWRDGKEVIFVIHRSDDDIPF